PGSDLIAKSITRNSSVIKIITTALVKTADDYFVAESEWGNGSRSDLVLSPRSSSFQLAPIIIEFQCRVDKKFMKRLMMYSLQAYRRYEKDPIILIICSGTLSDDVANLLKSSDVLGCRRYLCEGWGAKCLIMAKESLSSLTASEKREPFASFGLFLTQSMPFSELSSDDETTKMLQSLAVDHYMSLIGNEAHLIDFIKGVLDKQEIFYNKILALADDDDKPRLREAI
ncbi:hypothetical protein BDB00DRAFT_749371, partial [Zychaea mexicana]|uniref:uncharacterized protein n=1 Tax=Zychaea mexicana TaxID=64656 RepID=UPI0022FF259D